VGAAPLLGCGSSKGAAGGSGGATSSSSGAGAGTATTSSSSMGGGGAGTTSSSSAGGGGAATSATSSTSTTNATSTTSSSSGNPGGPCGGVTCRGGQVCVQSACVYQGCTGYNVPGDYATIQDAVTALTPMGGTICLAAQTYTEDVSSAVVSSNVVTIQGISAAKTKLTGSMTLTSSVNLQGFTVEGYVTLENAGGGGGSLLENMEVDDAHFGAVNVIAGTLTIRASKILETGTGLPDAVYVENDSTLVLDGDDVSATSGYAIYEQVGAPLVLTLQNSYVHDSVAGVVVDPSLSTYTIVNNTFVNAGSAIEIGLHTDDSVRMLTYENNLFVNGQLAVSINPASGMVNPPAFGHNGFFGNMTNFGGAAVDGAGDVKADPLLQTSTTPPSLGAGSPARGAGDASVAPTTDYWGNPRGASVDLGCVQAP
jgi:hypothetical protein